MNLRRFCRRDDFFFGRTFLAVGNVVKDRTAEQPGFLQYHRICRTQAVARDLTNVVSVHGNRSRLRVIEAHQKIDDGRFSRPGRTDDGDHLAGCDIE